MDSPLATVSPIAPSQTTRRLELIDSLYQLALASSAELEIAVTALDPYDVNRFAIFFARADDANAQA